MFSLTNRTDPSHNTNCTPPVWDDLYPLEVAQLFHALQSSPLLPLCPGASLTQVGKFNGVDVEIMPLWLLNHPSVAA